MFILVAIGEVFTTIAFALLDALLSIVMIIPNAFIALFEAVVQFCFLLPSTIVGGIATVLGAVWSLLTFWV